MSKFVQRVNFETVHDLDAMPIFEGALVIGDFDAVIMAQKDGSIHVWMRSFSDFSRIAAAIRPMITGEQYAG